MATISSNGTGGGNWSSPGSWAGGIAPTSTDDVVIVSGDVITKDTAKSSPDCGLIDVEGTLDIPTGAGLLTSGGHTGTGTNGLITIRGNGSLETQGNFDGYTGLWDVRGSSPDIASLVMNNHYLQITGGTFIDALIDNPFYSKFNGNTTNIYFENTELYSCDYMFWGLNVDPLILNKCWVAGCTIEWFYTVKGRKVYFNDCIFGRRRDGSAASNGTDCRMSTGSGGIFMEYRNCLFYSPSFRGNVSLGSVAEIYDFNQEKGHWRMDNYSGYFERSADAAKSGSYGIIIENVQDGRTNYCDFQCPILAGETISPSVWVRQIGADLGLSDGDFEIEFDVGNAWGLNEVLSPSPAFNGGWQEVTFTGGTVAATNSGFALIQMRQKKYVNGGQIHIADPSWDSVSFANGRIAAASSGSGSSITYKPFDRMRMLRGQQP